MQHLLRLVYFLCLVLVTYALPGATTQSVAEDEARSPYVDVHITDIKYDRNGRTNRNPKVFDTIAKVGIRPPLHSLIVMGPEGWALAEWTGKPGVPFEINRIKSNGRVEGKPKLTVGGREPYESKGNARDPGIVRNVAKLASKLVDVWKSNWNAQNPGIARNVAELAYEHVTAWNDKPTANHKEGMERLEAAMLVEDQKEVSKGGPDYYTQWDIIARTVTDEMNHRVAQLGKPYPVEEAAAGTDLAGLETQHSPVDATALHPETVVEPANDLHPPPIAE